MTSTLNRRSKLITAGVARSPNRAMLRAVGFGDGDFEKPIVRVAPGPPPPHTRHPRTPPPPARRTPPATPAPQPRVDRGGAAREEAGAKPQVFGVPTVTVGIGMGTEAMKY